MDDGDFKDEINRRMKQEAIARRVLGVDESAGEREVKKAYWMRAMENHPDKRPGDPEAQRKFQNIVNAYEFLMEGGTLRSDVEAPEEDEEDERIGEYLSNDWGYFCWWRQSFPGAAQGEGEEQTKEK